MSKKILVHAICNRDLVNFMPIISLLGGYIDNQYYINFDYDEVDFHTYKKFIANNSFFKVAPHFRYTIFGDYDIAFIIAPYGFNDYLHNWIRLKNKGCKLIYLDYGSTVLNTWKDFRYNYMSSDEDKQMINDLVNTVDHYICDDGDIDFYKTYYKNLYKNNVEKFINLNTSTRLFDTNLYSSEKHDGKNILVSLRVPRTNDADILNGLSFEILPRMLQYAMENPNVNVYFRIHANIETSFHQTVYWYSKRYSNIHYDNTEYDDNLYSKYDIFKKMDIFISDYSSILYEYTSYNKPVICVDMKNKNNYTKNVKDLMYFCKPEKITNYLKSFKDTKKDTRIEKLEKRFRMVDSDKKLIESIL